MTNRTTRDILILAALSALLLIPAAAFRGILGMEFRTALFVREILAQGPSLIPRLDGAPYPDYPPLYFLTAALSSRLLGGISPLSLALPSMAAALGTLLLTYFLAERGSPGTGLAAGTALALTPLFFTWASRGSVDAMLVFFTTLALAGCFRYVSSASPGALAAACAGLAGGALAKGPVGAAIPLCAVAAWLLVAGRFRDLAALMLRLGFFLAALAAACGAAVFLAEGREPLARLLGAQLFDRVGDQANQPLMYYLWVFLGGFAPWSLLALGRLFRRRNPAHREFESFCACWFLSTFALLTLASTKHSRYLLPAAPPVAILAAAWWDDLGREGSAAWLSAAAWTRRVCLCLLAAGAAFAAAAPLFLQAASPVLWPIIPAACLVPIAAPAVRTNRDARGSLLLLACALAAGFLIYTQFDSPRTTAKDEARPFVHSVEAAAGGARIVFYGIDRDADGLKFRYWRRGTGPLAFTESLPALRAALGGGTPALLVLPSRERGGVERDLGPRLRFLFEGRLGKRRCAVFVTADQG